MDVSMDSSNDVEDNEDEIDYFQKQDGSNTVLIGPYHVNIADLKSLDGSNWITDQVVNSYLYLLKSFAQDTEFLDSFWLPTCIRKGIMGVRKLEKLENKRLLLIPVHKPAHWGLVIAYIQEGYFVVVDTLQAFGKDVSTVIRNSNLQLDMLTIVVPISSRWPRMQLCNCRIFQDGKI